MTQKRKCPAPPWLDKGARADMLAKLVAGIEANPALDLRPETAVDHACVLLEEIVERVEAST